MSQPMLVTIKVTWAPARGPEAGDTKLSQTLARERKFCLRPQEKEEVLIDGTFYKVTHFFHDTDAERACVCLTPFWFAEPKDAQVKIAELEKKGWVRI